MNEGDLTETRFFRAGKYFSIVELCFHDVQFSCEGDLEIRVRFQIAKIHSHGTNNVQYGDVQYVSLDITS